MSRSNHKVSEGGVKTADHDGLSEDFENLKDGVVQLRDDLSKDVSQLAATVVHAGKSGVDAARQTAADAVDGVKDGLLALQDRGQQSAKAVKSKISDNPVASSLIAFATGFIVAKLISRK
jgi:ElaB/YqjD/DUF883 family membrane-anchored ribosome-binding protein